MLKKRLIFTLLYAEGSFMLSRNFRLQRVGDLGWLEKNYDFSRISYSIDELIILDVTRGERDAESFCRALESLAKGCFVPIAAGGGVRSPNHAQRLLDSGADKVVINTPLFNDSGLVDDLASEFGQQCVVASVDVKYSAQEGYTVQSNSGSRREAGTAQTWLTRLAQYRVGEIYLNSIDRDGTGRGYDMKLLDLLPEQMPIPVILAGGVGNAAHLALGIADPRADAVSTANLFNFVGDGLKRARLSLIAGGVDLPLWDIQLLEHHLQTQTATPSENSSSNNLPRVCEESPIKP